MMKWGRRKAKRPSSSPSRDSSISHVFPMSWLSIFKQKGNSNSGPKPAKEKQEAKPNTVANWRDGRFYGVDDESSGRISFADERFQGERKCRGGLQVEGKTKYLDGELEFASLSCPNCRGREIWKFGDKVSDFRKTRDLPETVPVEREEKCKELKDQKWRKTSPSVYEEKPEGFERRSDKAEETGIITEDYPSEVLNLEDNKEEMISKSQRWIEMTIKELLFKNDKQRKSVHTSRKGKFRVYSPTTLKRVQCRIKPIEDMKRSKTKIKKKTKTVESMSFDSFPVVKNSVDPELDFRNSMIEMITEKGLRTSEDLEELLVRYLTLNADEFHDVIINVFRQVWFELNQMYFSPGS